MLRSFVLATIMLATLGASASTSAGEFKAGVFDPPRLAPDFELPGTHGKPLKIADYRGKIVVLGFGFTHCPEVCPMTLATLAAARKELGDAAREVQVIWITVDPERDDADRLGKYVTAFDPSFVGGTGSEAELAAVRKDYGIAAAKIQKEGRPDGWSHSAFTYLVDRDGKLRALMPYGHPAADFVNDLRLLLAAP
jgi:protein SCO1/2